MIRLTDISHHYQLGRRSREKRVPVLHGISLHVPDGEVAALVGRSGSGKSTLLHLAGGFLRPSTGRIELNGTDATAFTEGEWANFRRKTIGFVFQNFQLIPGMTGFENAELPLVLDGVPAAERRRSTLELLERLGIAEYADHYPGELSGGQQQRFGIARALALRPPLLLADEPTGSLDSENEERFLSLLRSLGRERKLTFLIVTHDDRVASFADRVLRMEDGRLAGSEAGNREVAQA